MPPRPPQLPLEVPPSLTSCGLRQREALGSSGTEERFRRVATARPVLLNYDLIRHDFPCLAAATAAEIDTWAIRNAAQLSLPQVAQTDVNTPVETIDDDAPGVRPKGYGRAAIFAPDCHCEERAQRRCGLLDVKGVGVAADRVPERRGHGTGLLILEQALIELVGAELFDLGMIAAGVDGIRAIPNYGVIDLGFMCTFRDSAPAAVLLRRAYRRNDDFKPFGSDEEHLELEVELALRRIGATLCTPATVVAAGEDGSVTHGGFPLTRLTASERSAVLETIRASSRSSEVHCINAQFAEERSVEPLHAHAIDLHVRTVPDLGSAFATAVVDRPAWLGTIITPDDPRFVLPAPALRMKIPSGDECAWYGSVVAKFARTGDRRWLRRALRRIVTPVARAVQRSVQTPASDSGPSIEASASTIPASPHSRPGLGTNSGRSA